jgi:UDP-N-acetylglucosamine 4,6-dehydratase/5-epimerase
MRVLITGGTGTFGYAAAEALLKAGHTVTIFSRDECKQEQMRARLQNHTNLRFFLGDVRDRFRVRLAMHGQQAVIHAAALKVVHKCEFDPIEAVKTNIYGSQNVVECALDESRERGRLVGVVLLSSDKAVHPVNLYGATKKAAEHLFLAAQNYTTGSRYPSERWVERLRFSVARYGNVWASRGSVVELWDTARKAGRPIEITDPSMTRFFMTALQAVALVMTAISEGLGGEIFVPKLRAYRLGDLAKAYAHVYSGVETRVAGRRHGEKIGEELISSFELARANEDGGGVIIIGGPQCKVGGLGTQAISLRHSDQAERISVEELAKFIEETENGTPPGAGL